MSYLNSHSSKQSINVYVLLKGLLCQKLIIRLRSAAIVESNTQPLSGGFLLHQTQDDMNLSAFFQLLFGLIATVLTFVGIWYKCHRIKGILSFEITYTHWA